MGESSRFIFQFKTVFCWLLTVALTVDIGIPAQGRSISDQKSVFTNKEGLDYFPHPPDFNFREWQDFLSESLSGSDPTLLELIGETTPNLVPLLIILRDHYAEARQQIDQIIAEHGTHRFKSMMDSDQYSYYKIAEQNADFGPMNFTSIDGYPAGRVLHKPSGVAFLVYDENEVPRSSRHLKQYLSRHSYDSGKTRKESAYVDTTGKIRKIRPGRDTVLMGIRTIATSDEAKSRVELHPRNKNIVNWWRATYKNPTQQNIFEGFTAGILQFGSTFAIAEMIATIMPGHTADNAPFLIASFTFAYGTMIGVWNSFYQNWRRRGSKVTRDLKAFSLSMMYYLGVMTISQYGSQELTVFDPSVTMTQVATFLEQSFQNTVTNPKQTADAALNSFTSWLQSISNVSVLAIAAKTHFYHNFLANNELKNVGYWLQMIPEIERKDLKVHTAKIGPLRASLSQRFINRQIVFQLPSQWIKQIDQIWFSTTIVPAMNGEIPQILPFFSMIGYWSSIVAGIYWVNWWGYKHHRAAADNLKIREESSYYFPQRPIQNALDKINQLLHKRNRHHKRDNNKPIKNKSCGTILVPDDIQ